MTGKFIRRASLIVLIITGAAFCGICWWGVAVWKTEQGFRPMIVPAVGFTGTYLWFLAVEVWGALTGYKKTLSTRYKHFLQQNTKFQWVGLIGLLLFWIAMTALCVHLGVFW